MTAQLACLVDDVAPGSALRVELEGESGPVEVAVVRDSSGEWHAISDVCSHGQVSLSDGDVEDCTIECWLHGSTFDLRTGRPLALPATRPVPVYPLTVDGDRVLVDVDTTVNA
ncbi:(2Fe-2S)-binding protein [Actinotalea ferrariae CF5-4]|uniref:(2Fe-2S)-binding protein n=1 Tax=Actinotalea ferrariae CF5-4 TaxID=948458 RepID=A0A021VN72_9CELL|nr:non-heme iron oxygenase ferredoxin subunit [Actinotalea ferrariae]EYR62606.1 (2Fe-2S)-binding protein [Actinotalea ferrariae CF5-4]